jgi:phosphotriesterase-related protein
MTARVQTVTGPIAPEQLGRTLMHEHVLVGYAGWEADWIRPGPSRREMIARAVDKLEEIKAEGITSMIDPCPCDLGRDIELTAEVAQRARFQIVAATGLYYESEGGAAHWKTRSAFGGAQDEAMAELFIRELEQGVASTGIRPGIIKVASGFDAITDYETSVMRAAAKASTVAGVPITTHTDRGTMGPEQQAILTGAGAAPNRIVIGHSCGTSDAEYHDRLVAGGTYLGFDRFGLDLIHPDAQRVESLLRLIRRGAGKRVVVSHDTVWCWRGQPIAKPLLDEIEKVWTPSHFTRRIVPRLLDGGATKDDVENLLIHNPRRFFAGEKLPAIG